MNAARRVEKLRPDHPIESFDCGREELNRYLLRYAWANQQAGAAQTYVGLVGDAVVGYHTLAVGQCHREEAPERLTRGWRAIRCRSCCLRAWRWIAAGRVRVSEKRS